MAFRFTNNCWRLVANSMKPSRRGNPTSRYSTAAEEHPESGKIRPVRGEFVPVYVAIGMIAAVFGLGAHTAFNLLKHCPNVRVKKERRERVAEVDEPEAVAAEAEEYFKKSLFRKWAHVQEYDHSQLNVPDPIRGDAYAHQPHVESLRDVGVNPKLHS